MRSARHIIAAAIVAAVPSLLATVHAAGYQTMTATDDSAMMAMDGPANDCGCRNRQQPPWHASVNGPACCPPQHHCGVFHADPCGQVHAKHEARRHGMILPPCFPRLHTWWAEGYMPTPPPLALPRCHQCGATIEGGF